MTQKFEILGQNFDHLVGGLDGTDGRDGAYFSFQKFWVIRRGIFFSFFFLNLFSYQGERFKIFPRTQQGNIKAQNWEIDQKIDHF